MSDYRAIQTAVRAEKLRIWLGWACGTFILLITAVATQNIHIVSVITQVALVVGFLALTIALFRMTGALNRRALEARRQVLGDDL
ncbi:MAG: hypothetical protein HOY76_36225 [Streptomyces sp.]|nr:hypothetical protein [Streptomyces sp.]NUS75779.1 hypothetical protein [Streptomyces sp.]